VECWLHVRDVVSLLGNSLYFAGAHGNEPRWPSVRMVAPRTNALASWKALFYVPVRYDSLWSPTLPGTVVAVRDSEAQVIDAQHMFKNRLPCDKQPEYVLKYMHPIMQLCEVEH
jgi:hypothetical protein